MLNKILSLLLVSTCLLAADWNDRVFIPIFPVKYLLSIDAKDCTIKKFTGETEAIYEIIVREDADANLLGEVRVDIHIGTHPADSYFSNDETLTPRRYKDINYLIPPRGSMALSDEKIISIFAKSESQEIYTLNEEGEAVGHPTIYFVICYSGALHPDPNVIIERLGLDVIKAPHSITNE